MQKIGEAFFKMFDSQKEWIGWIFGGLAVWMGAKLFAMTTPHALHMQAFIYTLFTTLGLVSAKALVEIVNALKGITKP